MARHIHLAPHLSLDELAGRYRSTKDPVERSRWHFLWLLARGLTAKVIAGITGYSAYWIGRIARRYNEYRPDGVTDQRHQRRSSRRLLTAAQQDELLVALAGPAPQHEQWNGRTIADWIARHLARPVCRHRWAGSTCDALVPACVCPARAMCRPTHRPKPTSSDGCARSCARWRRLSRGRASRCGPSTSTASDSSPSSSGSGRCLANAPSLPSSIATTGATSSASCIPPRDALSGISRRPSPLSSSRWHWRRSPRRSAP